MLYLVNCDMFSTTVKRVKDLLESVDVCRPMNVNCEGAMSGASLLVMTTWGIVIVTSCMSSLSPLINLKCSALRLRSGCGNPLNLFSPTEEERSSSKDS